MNEKIIPFFKAVGLINSGVFKRDVLIRHAVALAISDLSTIPSAPVESVEAAFNNIARLHAESILSAFNEISPLNYNETLKLVRGYWISRYRLAVGAPRVFTGDDYLDSISGMASAISPDELGTLNESLEGDFSDLYKAARHCIENYERK